MVSFKLQKKPDDAKQSGSVLTRAGITALPVTSDPGPSTAPRQIFHHSQIIFSFFLHNDELSSRRPKRCIIPIFSGMRTSLMTGIINASRRRNPTGALNGVPADGRLSATGHRPSPPGVGSGGIFTSVPPGKLKLRTLPKVRRKSLAPEFPNRSGRERRALNLCFMREKKKNS